MSEHLADPRPDDSATAPGQPRPATHATPDPLPPDDDLDGRALLPEGLAVPDAAPRDGPRLDSPRRGRRLTNKPDAKALALTPQQRLLRLDTWIRSGLPAGDFAPLVDVSKFTLYEWKR